MMWFIFIILVLIQTQLQTLQQGIDTNLDDIYFLDSLVVTDSLNRDSLQQLIAQKAQTIRPLMQQVQQIWQLVKQNRLIDAGFIESNNNVILSIELAEQNLKMVNDIYLKTIAKGIYQFSHQQEQDLHNIALQCPLEGGVAVYKARSMVTIFTRVNYELLEDCTPQANPQARLFMDTETETVKAKSLEVKLYPNPATNQITLEWALGESNIEASSRKVLVFNALGQLVHQQNTPDVINTINTTNWVSGLYICKLHQEGEEVHTEKIIIVKP